MSSTAYDRSVFCGNRCGPYWRTGGGDCGRSRRAGFAFFRSAAGDGRRRVAGRAAPGADFHRASRRPGSLLHSDRPADDALRFGAGAGRFLDPCCGSGHYLVRAASVLKLGPDRIYGIECDPSRRSWRGSISAGFRSTNSLRIFSGGRARRADSAGGVRLVRPGGDQSAVGGGPERTGGKLCAVHPAGAAFSRPGGQAVVSPAGSGAEYPAHAPLRRMLFEECRIESVTLLGRCFTGVFTPVVRLDAVNAPPGRRTPVPGRPSGRCARTAPPGARMPRLRHRDRNFGGRPRAAR